jgi:hypothetical protein
MEAAVGDGQISAVTENRSQNPTKLEIRKTSAVRYQKSSGRAAVTTLPPCISLPPPGPLVNGHGALHGRCGLAVSQHVKDTSVNEPCLSYKWGVRGASHPHLVLVGCTNTCATYAIFEPACNQGQLVVQRRSIAQSRACRFALSEIRFGTMS